MWENLLSEDVSRGYTMKTEVKVRIINTELVTDDWFREHE
jgi:hypothetical protein